MNLVNSIYIVEGVEDYFLVKEVMKSKSTNCKFKKNRGKSSPNRLRKSKIRYSDQLHQT